MRGSSALEKWPTGSGHGGEGFGSIPEDRQMGFERVSRQNAKNGKGESLKRPLLAVYLEWHYAA